MRNFRCDVLTYCNSTEDASWETLPPETCVLSYDQVPERVVYSYLSGPGVAWSAGFYDPAGDISSGPEEESEPGGEAASASWNSCSSVVEVQFEDADGRTSFFAPAKVCRALNGIAAF